MESVNRGRKNLDGRGEEKQCGTIEELYVCKRGNVRRQFAKLERNKNQQKKYANRWKTWISEREITRMTTKEKMECKTLCEKKTQQTRKRARGKIYSEDDEANSANTWEDNKTYNETRTEKTTQMGHAVLKENRKTPLNVYADQDQQ